MNLPYYIKNTIKKIEENNYEAFVVGGAVRDYIIGCIPSDFDIATNATPEEIKRIFSNFNVIDTGIKHGTVSLIINKYCVEITTYRSDGKYLDNRHPNQITFVKTLKEDVSRRDFTMNAIAYNKNIVDYFGGIDDIENKIIRTVGNSDKRFKEDALRILRAIRFSSTLNFQIEEETSIAIHKNAKLLSNVSAERIRTEFTKTLLGVNCFQALNDYIDVIGVFIPEVLHMVGFNQNNKHHIDDLIIHTLKVVKMVKPVNYLRLAAFLHDFGKVTSYSVDSQGEGHFYGHEKISAKLAETIMRRLKYSNKDINKVITLIENHMIQIEANEKQLKRLIQKIGIEDLMNLLDLQEADQLSKNKDNVKFFKIRNLIKKIQDEDNVFSIKDLDINGHDLINVGLIEGPIINKILNQLLEEVVEGNIKNQKELLIDYAIKIKNNIDISL